MPPPLHCNNCQRSAGRLCQSNGNIQSGLVILGDSPGENELVSGHPFVGQAGHFLIEAMRKNCIDLYKDCYLMNCLNCDVHSNLYKMNQGTRANLSRRRCRDRVIQEICALPNALVIALGVVPLRAIEDVGNLRIEDYRNTWGSITCPESGRIVPVVYTYHPSSALREIYNPNSTKFSDFCEDIRKGVEQYRKLSWESSIRGILPILRK